METGQLSFVWEWRYPITPHCVNLWGQGRKSGCKGMDGADRDVRAPAMVQKLFLTMRANWAALQLPVEKKLDADPRFV